MRWKAFVLVIVFLFLASCHRYNRAPEKPSLLKPGNGSVVNATNVQLSWDAKDPDGDPLTFEVYFGEEPEFFDETTATTYLVSVQKGKTYRWKVVAKDPFGGKAESDVWEFRTQSPPEKPTLIYPENGAVGVPKTVEFKWKAKDPDGDPLKYTFQLRDVGGNLLKESSGIESTSLVMELELGKVYLWRVKAEDPYGNSTWRDQAIFTTQSPPVTPVLLSPLDGASLSSMEVTLSWYSYDPDGDEVFFDVYFGFAGKELALAKHNATSTSLTITVPERGKQYEWMVVAKDEYGNSSKSPKWSFYVQ